jgi:hypothetical protein
MRGNLTLATKTYTRAGGTRNSFNKSNSRCGDRETNSDGFVLAGALHSNSTAGIVEWVDSGLNKTMVCQSGGGSVSAYEPVERFLAAQPRRRR